MNNIDEIIKITETVKKFLPPDYDVTDHAKIHYYFMMNNWNRRDFLRKLEYQHVPDQIVNEYLELLSSAYIEKCKKEALNKIVDQTLEVRKAMNKLGETASQLIRYMDKDYIYVGYSCKHEKYALIDKGSFIRFNYNVNLIRENMDQYVLTYVENLTDLECC